MATVPLGECGSEVCGESKWGPGRKKMAVIVSTPLTMAMGREKVCVCDPQSWKVKGES